MHYIHKYRYYYKCTIYILCIYIYIFIIYITYNIIYITYNVKYIIYDIYVILYVIYIINLYFLLWDLSSACRVSLTITCISSKRRSSSSDVFYKIGVLKTFTKFAETHLCRSLFLEPCKFFKTKTPGQVLFFVLQNL